jgi:hypothetical protein
MYRNGPFTHDKRYRVSLVGFMSIAFFFFFFFISYVHSLLLSVFHWNVCFNTIAFRQLDYQLWQCVFVLGHRFALKKKKAIDIKPTGETRYFLSWVHKRTISVHFTDIMLGFSFFRANLCPKTNTHCHNW